VLGVSMLYAPEYLIKDIIDLICNTYYLLYESFESACRLHRESVVDKIRGVCRLE